MLDRLAWLGRGAGVFDLVNASINIVVSMPYTSRLLGTCSLTFVGTSTPTKLRPLRKWFAFGSPPDSTF